MSAIPYYWVNPKNNRAYWRPNRRMMLLGFGSVALGLAGPDAEAEAQGWNERWQQARKEDPVALGIRAARCEDPPQYVYFLRIDERIKIGTSKHAFARIAEIAAGAHARPRQAVVVIGNQRDEKRLHTRFRAYRTHGEWFVASKPILLTMSRCVAAGRVIHDGDGGTECDLESNHFENRVKTAFTLSELTR